jgi:hypothetical protein
MFKFYKNLSFQDSIDHTMDNWDVNNPYSFRQWYNEDIQDKDNLLVVVGDSWTWGDHLGTIDWDKNVNDPIRLTQIYGRLLSTKLNADWVNIAKPGCSNYWMLKQLANIKQYLETANYKNIFLIVVFTEDFRELSYRETNHNAEWELATSLKEFFISAENKLYTQMQDYANSLPNVKTYFTRVFTDTHEENMNFSSLLKDSWCDAIQQKIQFPFYQKPVPFLGQLATNPLTAMIGDNLAYKSEFVDIMQTVEYRWNFLGFSEYNLKGSTYHPTPSGHELWADYLFEIFK